MTLGGWVFMSVSLAAVTTLVLACYRKILTAPKEQGDPPDEKSGNDSGSR